MACSAVGVVVGTALAAGLGASRAVILSLAPRSVTTPIALGTAEQIGGLPPLSAALVIASGVLGAVEEGEVEGAASSLAIGLMGVATALLAPPLVWLLARLW